MKHLRLRTGRGTKWLTALLGVALVFGWPSRGAEEANAPLVQIYFPAPKAEVSGVIQVRVRAFSPYGIHFIEVYVDDLPRSLGVRNTEPFTFNLATARFTDGIHTVRALLVDYKGVEQWSDPVEIEIRNAPRPVVAPNPIVPPPAGAHGVIAPPGALPLPVPGAEGAAVPGNAALGRVTLPADALRPRSGVAVASAAPVASVPDSLRPRAAGVVSAAPLGVPSGRVASEPVLPVSVRAMAHAAGTTGAVSARATSTAPRPAQSSPAAASGQPATRTVSAPRAATSSAPRAVTATPAGAPRTTSVSAAPSRPAGVPMVPSAAPATRPAPARSSAQTPPQSSAAVPAAAPRAQAESAPVAAPAEPVRFASLSALPAAIGRQPLVSASARTGVLFNGRLLSTDVAFHLVGGLALAPLRAVAEASGAVVMWEPSQRHAAIYLRGRRIIITADSTDAIVDGATVHLAMPPRIVSDRMLVPARFLADLLQMRVGYDAASRQLLFRPR